jgi:hypothetical protein
MFSKLFELLKQFRVEGFVLIEKESTSLMNPGRLRIVLTYG